VVIGGDLVALPLGCDVSFRNRGVNWAGAKADGVEFAGIRWGQRDGHTEPDGSSWTDPDVEDNWNGAADEEIERMAYWVWDERDGNTAQEHMDGVLAVAVRISGGRYDGEISFVVDLELEPVDWNELHEFLVLLENWSGERPRIYSGSWFYDRVDPLPEWLEEYEHWMTGYNDDGPSIWGPIAELDIDVVCWQQANNWQVTWCGLGAVDRNYWTGDTTMTDEMFIPVEKLLAFIEDNQQLCAEPPPDPPEPPVEFFIRYPVNKPVVVTQWYGVNAQWYNPYGLPGHEGVDFRAPNGSPVYAGFEGTVYRVDENVDQAYGMHVRIKHEVDDKIYKTVYAHFQKALVEVGDKVKTGQQIGEADNTGNSSGPHLHLSLKLEGIGSDSWMPHDLINPVPYMPDLFWPGREWVTDVGGNFRTGPVVSSNNLIRYIGSNQKVAATGEFDDDWWEIVHIGVKGWFWNPGYKLRAT